MILRQLSISIRKQDWFAVLIEFAIVVLGIFAGLQANNWANERDDRRQERAALERLFVEAENTHSHLNNQVERTLRMNQMRRNAVQFADSDASLPENDLPLRVGINTLAILPPVVPVSIVFEELQAAGQMQLVRSAELRSQVGLFHASLAFYTRLQQRFVDDTAGFTESYLKHVVWAYNPESTTTDIVLSTFNWASLRSDKKFISVMIGLLRNQLVLEEALIDLRDQANSMCQALGEAVSRPCMGQ